MDLFASDQPESMEQTVEPSDAQIAQAVWAEAQPISAEQSDVQEISSNFPPNDCPSIELLYNCDFPQEDPKAETIGDLAVLGNQSGCLNPTTIDQAMSCSSLPADESCESLEDYDNPVDDSKSVSQENSNDNLGGEEDNGTQAEISPQDMSEACGDDGDIEEPPKTSTDLIINQPGMYTGFGGVVNEENSLPASLDGNEEMEFADISLRDDDKGTLGEAKKTIGARMPRVRPRDFKAKAMKAAREFNLKLNQERRFERRNYVDQQTKVVHRPVGLGLENKTLSKPDGPKEPRRYPIALLPGQYQDWYVEYTPEELKYMPINSVMYGPIVTDPNKIPPLLYGPDETQSSSDDSENEGPCDGSHSSSCCSSLSGDHSGEDNFTSSDDEDIEPPKLEVLPTASVKAEAICHRCEGKDPDKEREEVISCSDCGKSSHPTCLEFTDEMVELIRSYPWQCMDCKSCLHCGKPHDEDKMMFCDRCDRGYHTYCVGVKDIPSGRWVCRICGQCAQCGSREPAPNDPQAQWLHETLKILGTPAGGIGIIRHQTLCHSCHAARKQR